MSELHPTTDSFSAVAGKFAAMLNILFKSQFVGRHVGMIETSGGPIYRLPPMTASRFRAASRSRSR